MGAHRYVDYQGWTQVMMTDVGGRKVGVSHLKTRTAKLEGPVIGEASGHDGRDMLVTLKTCWQ